MKPWMIVGLLVVPFLFAGSLLSAQAKAPAEASLVSFSAGALIAQKPSEYDESWSTLWLLDENPTSGWACAEGKIRNNVVVIALAEKTLLKRMEFDTASIDGDGRGARDITIEISDTGPAAGFQKIAQVTLADRKDRQSFAVTTPTAGRWLRLTIQNNHGAEDYTELFDVRGYGQQLTKTPMPDVSGTYASDYNDFHLRQQGTAVTGCYEFNEGVLNGGIEGRIMKFTWREGEQKGPAIFVFSPDGRRFTGLWWREGQEKSQAGIWNGTLKGKQIGGCPHWSGGAQEQMTRELEQFGRVRVYGINFDVDSAVIRDESKPILDKMTAMLKAEAGLKLTIEGHTDASGDSAHNQQLSQQRAEAVKTYLVNAGIAAARLRSVGLGATKPVAGNDTAMGRAQNRRVELVKN